ncbi:MAG: hypothetical protein M0Z36_10625 [Thermaerobacter sp.]|nr:hypothetical protein [Thermaerobacter sp.]
MGLGVVVPGLAVIPLQRAGIGADQIALGWDRAVFSDYNELVFGIAAALSWHKVARRWWVGGGWVWRYFGWGVIGGLGLAVLTSLAGVALLS